MGMYEFQKQFIKKILELGKIDKKLLILHPKDLGRMAFMKSNSKYISKSILPCGHANVPTNSTTNKLAYTFFSCRICRRKYCIINNDMCVELN